MQEELEKLLLKHALANAVKYGGKASLKAVVSKVFAEAPELRKDARRVVEAARAVIEKVNSMSPDEQRRLLEQTWPGALEERRKEEKKGLPPLPGAEEVRQVVTRFAPNPDFVLHLGSARPAILSYYYAKEMYRGRFILRFEDTDPKVKRPIPEAYELIRDDLRWLGLSWDEEHIQSRRMEIYYWYATKLLEQGHAYICTHTREEIKRYRDAGQPDPCRSLPPEEHLERWDKMLSGEYGEGEAVLRIKTDPAHPNPSVRDWIAFRVVDTSKTPHPLVGDRYVAWPTYNFACSIDDHLLGVTHILRGKEHAVNTVKQEYIYRYFGWKMPYTIHFGRLHLEGMILSKSVIRKGIEEGRYTDWRDIRLGTLQALRRRGILPQAIWDLIMEVGVKPSTAVVSVDKLHALNRKYLEPIADRYMFVPPPYREVKLEGIGEAKAVLLYHPSHPERGKRVVEAPGNSVYVNEKDLQAPEIRLMGLGNFRVKGESLEYVGGGVEYAREKKLPIIQWAPAATAVQVQVLRARGDELEEIQGPAEPAVAELKEGSQVQFLRFGFVKKESGSLFLYTHD